jgi:hypothetical protein
LVEQDKPRFQQALAALADVHNRELTASTLRGYFMALKDLPIDQVEAGVFKCLRELEYFPKPVEIRRQVPTAKPVKLAALEAWQMVMQHAYGHRARRGPMDFGTVTNAAVRAIGGLERIVQGRTTELESFTRPRFVEAYELLAATSSDELHGAPLSIAGVEGKSVQRIGAAEVDRERIESKPDKLVVSLAKSLAASRKEDQGWHDQATAIKR